MPALVETFISLSCFISAAPQCLAYIRPCTAAAFGQVGDKVRCRHGVQLDAQVGMSGTQGPHKNWVATRHLVPLAVSPPDSGCVQMTSGMEQGEGQQCALES